MACLFLIRFCELDYTLSPTTNSSKVHTLYVGDSVYIYDWQTNLYLTDGHYWARLRHYDTNNRAYYYGYSANCLLS